MKNAKLKIGIAVLGLAIGLVAGCMSITTTETMAPVKQPDGSYQTNWVKTVKEKHADPLKDKIVRATSHEVGFDLQLLPSPAGTSGGLSPVKLFFGMAKGTVVTIPVYPPVQAGTNGYTPPLSYAASSAGSLYNDSDVENLNTVGQLPGTNAYYATPITPVSIIQPLTGTVAAPPASVQFVTNTITQSTNGTSTSVITK